MKRIARALPWLTLGLFLLITTAVYAPGLTGGFVFDDFPNIVDNSGVHPRDGSIGSLWKSALSSPSSEFKRPLASLTFAANYLATGGDPYWMKATNLIIHLANGVLAFLLCRLILSIALPVRDNSPRIQVTAALIAGCWLLLPINVTAVVYVVQRMESLANLFVLLGLIGYVKARINLQSQRRSSQYIAALMSLIGGTAIGALAKETAVMLPLYAFVIELFLFRFKSTNKQSAVDPTRDRRIDALFIIVLWLPMAAGLTWLLPGLLRPSGWSTRDFTMSTRLLTEARVVTDYLVWTLAPTPGALSFYHDDTVISTGLLTPWTTLASILALASLSATAWFARRRLPLASLGIGWYIACHLLTGTILPLELVYEHRNYFASLGVMLAVVPFIGQPAQFSGSDSTAFRLKLIGPILLAGLLLLWTALTTATTYAWGNPLRLATEFASRAPESPRAQYELGRTYIILSEYHEDSPFNALVYAPLEKAAKLPGSSILAEQALIFFNARMHRGIKPDWWNSIATKLVANKVTVQDESALGSLSDCMKQKLCDIPAAQMERAYVSALSHPQKSPRLLAMYSDFAWNSLGDRELAVRMAREASLGSPREPAYAIALIDKLVITGNTAEAAQVRDRLATLNVGGSLNADLDRIDRELARN